MARTRNFADVIRAKLAANATLAKGVEREAFNADIAMKVFQVRTEANLTQKQLAARIGTRQSVISRIEDAEYEGHSLAILKRIAKALGRELRVEFYAKPVQLPTVVATTTVCVAPKGAMMTSSTSSLGPVLADLKAQ